VLSGFCCRTEIEWLPGKCLTQKILKKKPKKGSKNNKPITKTENCESFFNFFNPPQVPEDDEDIDEDTVSCHHHLPQKIIRNKNVNVFLYALCSSAILLGRLRSYRIRWSKIMT